MVIVIWQNVFIYKFLFNASKLNKYDEAHKKQSFVFLLIK